MAITFEVRHTEGLSRQGTLTTPHGEIQTPALMPVINPNRMTLAPDRMASEHGARIVITNSYIIQGDEDLKAQALADGVHALIGWDGPVMTDSGTFQDYVYGDRGIDPAEIVAFQRDIGTDIGTILDVFSTPDRSHEEALEDLTETTQRARGTLAEAGEMALNLPVQGATYPDLRQQAAEEMAAVAPVGGAVHPIGGVVPIMERQRYTLLAEVILGAKRGLHPGRPVHLFGAGHPHMLALAVYLGCDLFDSAAYAKFAQGDRLLFPWGTEELADLEELACSCPVCRSWTPDELMVAGKGERIEALASHNLHATFQELTRIREAQRRGRLFDLVLERAMGHPRLLEVLGVLREHVDQVEAEEPLSYHRAINLQPAYHQARAQVHRAQARVADRTQLRGPPVLLPATRRPFTENAPALVHAALNEGLHPFFPTRLGPIPFEIDQAYPFTQSLEPEMGELDAIDQRQRLAKLAKAWGAPVAEREDLDPVDEASVQALDEARIRGIIAYQFGPGAETTLLDGSIRLERSDRTGKVRTVHVDDEHVASLRAHDGLLSLRLPGARRLRDGLAAPRLRVRVTGDSAPFNADGRTVFAGFTTEVDPELRPGDQVLVVDPEDRLVAVGQLLVSVPELQALEDGPVVKVRAGIGEKAYEAL